MFVFLSSILNAHQRRKIGNVCSIPRSARLENRKRKKRKRKSEVSVADIEKLFFLFLFSFLLAMLCFIFSYTSIEKESKEMNNDRKYEKERLSTPRGKKNETEAECLTH